MLVDMVKINTIQQATYNQDLKTRFSADICPEVLAGRDSLFNRYLRLHPNVNWRSALLIRPSGKDFHFYAAELMKEKGRAPAVAEFAVAVDRRVLRRNERGVKRIV